MGNLWPKVMVFEKNLASQGGCKTNETQTNYHFFHFFSSGEMDRGESAVKESAVNICLERNDKFCGLFGLVFVAVCYDLG